jgi:hypothetical protein
MDIVNGIRDGLVFIPIGKQNISPEENKGERNECTNRHPLHIRRQ